MSTQRPYQSFDNIEQFQRVVSKAVKEQLGHYPWFVGVCMDDLDQFFPGKLDEAIEYAYCETLYWDAPNHGFDITMNAEEV
jgi:hypothetical protein